MKINRRDFLRFSGATLLSTQVPSNAFASNDAYAAILALDSKRLPIVQGPTDRSTAAFAVLHGRDARLLTRVLDADGSTQFSAVVDSMELPGTGQCVSHVFTMGLLPNVVYRLQVSDEAGNIFDERTFRTLDLDRKKARFAVVSCMNESHTKAAVEMWQTLSRENVDFVIFCGDTVYADIGNPNPSEAGFARRYTESRRALQWFRLPHLIPSFATWDDHDFGANNADASFKHGAITRQLFLALWGSRLGNLAWQPGLGVGGVFEAFEQRFYLLDGRSYREKNSSKSGRMWGSEQTDWLLADLEKSSRPAWLMSGSQFFGGYLGKESFEGDHRNDFKDLLGRLSNVEAPVSFVSGDVHFSELMEIESSKLGYRSYEFTSSSMHSLTLPYHQHRASNPRRLTSEWRHNFLVLESNVENGWQVNAKCVLNENVVSFAQDMQIIRG